MHIDWPALAIVAAVSIGTTVAFVALLAAGVRLVSAARVRTNLGRSTVAPLTLGYTALGLAGMLVLFGLYLIVPQLH